MTTEENPARPTRPYRMVARAAASEATEQSIRDAAVRLFGELLYDQVSLQSVADQAGVTVQTVLRRFRSKEELFAAAAERMTQQIRAERDVVAIGDVDGAVENTIDTYERWGDQILNLLAQDERMPAIRELTDFGRRHHYGWVEEVFGPLLNDDPADVRSRRVAQLIAVTDLFVWKVLRRDLKLSRHDTEAAVRDLIDHLLRPPDERRAWDG